jgi:ArsR family transcriptional regulator
MTKDKTQEKDMELLARYAKAMGHPTRIEILKFLAKRKECYFGAINDELPIAKATVSQHLKELKTSGLIQGEIEMPKVKYCINMKEWQKAKELFNDFFCDIDQEKSCCCKKDEK